MSTRSAPAPNPRKKSSASSRRTSKKAAGTNAPKAEAVSYHRKPETLDHAAWQKELRRQYIPEMPLLVSKLEGGHPVFGDYEVSNPASGRTYRVAFRDGKAGLNWCECLDFKTNLLGTCKHVEAVLRFASRKRGAKKALREGYVPSYSSVYLHYGETRTVRLRIGTDKAEAFARLSRKWFDGDGILKPESFSRFELFLDQAASLDEAFRCYDDALAFVLARRDAEWRRLAMERHFADPNLVASLLKTRLYPYQILGIRFAATAGRALLADEMGLGKTIQAIGTAEVLRRVAGIERVLVICPTSLKYQWRSEIMRFTDSTVDVIEGPLLARAKQYRGDAFFKVVSYHAVARDLEAITRMSPDLVILDEAQRIKNWKTRIAQTVKRIESPYALVLTGTPLENKLEELYSIVSFIDPWKLGPFWRFLADHQVTDGTGKITGYRGLTDIGKSLSDITLRRRKREVLADLPPRIDKRIFVPMTEAQRSVHDEFEASVSMLVNKWRGKGFLTEPERQRLLILLNQMRMVCDSTYILDQDAARRQDTKVGELMGILDECLGDPDQKVVVFSQWERMTRLVAKELEERGIGYRSLHGGVPSAARKELYDSFNSLPECRVFLSTDAGSTGLNLQAASILVNLDLPWNPAVLEQRIGRIHRIGQKSAITVINLVSIDSIESRMLNLIGFKSDLARGVLDSGEDSIFMGDDKYRRFMAVVEDITTEPGGAPMAVPAGEGGAGDSLAEGHGELIEAEEALEPKEPLAAKELLDRGISLLADFGESLAAPGGAEAFIAAIAETDGATGQTWLKIPVENQAVAAEALSTLAKLLSALRVSPSVVHADKAQNPRRVNSLIKRHT